MNTTVVLCTALAFGGSIFTHHTNRHPPHLPTFATQFTSLTLNVQRWGVELKGGMQNVVWGLCERRLYRQGGVCGPHTPPGGYIGSKKDCVGEVSALLVSPPPHTHTHGRLPRCCSCSAWPLSCGALVGCEWGCHPQFVTVRCPGGGGGANFFFQRGKIFFFFG